MKTHPLHEKALVLAKEYLKLESELITLLQRVEREKIHLFLGYRSLFQYCVEALGLGENQSYTFIGVSRKCVEVPALQSAIEEGKINTSTAKKILPVIGTKNSELWISKAQELSQKELEREVAKQNPEREIRESLKQVTVSQSEFRTQVNLDLEKKLARCREIVRQKTGDAASWEKVLEALANLYLEKQDPVQKAERVLKKQQVLRPVKSKSLPAFLRHQVMKRDQGRCQYPSCNQRHWIEIHHKIPLSNGGKHELGNLITLCSTHHQKLHDFQGGFWRRVGRAANAF